MGPDPKRIARDVNTSKTKKVSKSNVLEWPMLHPLVPTSDLSLTVYSPDQILLIRNFWTASLCKKYVTFLSSLPLQTTSSRPKKGEAVRVNDRFSIDDPVFARSLWESTSLKNLLTGFDASRSTGAEYRDSDEARVDTRAIWGGDLAGLSPNIRIYRYSKGQYFAPHYDESNSVLLPSQPPTAAITTWTLLIYLTSPATGCVGGETVFYPEPSTTTTTKTAKKSHASDPLVVDLETGMALLHRHGPNCMLHEGREVQAGEKWVLRSDVCVVV